MQLTLQHPSLQFAMLLCVPCDVGLAHACLDLQHCIL
jgi:hypothetical protein